MPTILGFAVAAAAYPQLLAIVVVILTRPEPRRLLWACYVGALTMSVGCGVAVLLVFRDRAGVLGASSHRLGAAPFLIGGVAALIVAAVVASESARSRLGRRLPRRRARSGDPGTDPDAPPEERESATRPGTVDRWKGSAKGALARGSIGVTFAVGLILGIPGPFDVLAIGRIVRAGYAILPSLVIIVVFNLIKFVLIELPIISYAIEPAETAARVERFSRWMKTNEIRVIAGVIAVIGLLLIGRGVSRL